MSVYKEKNGRWRVIYRFTDWTGERKQTQKRGFETRREAVEWEHEQATKTKQSLDMTFGSFFELYEKDMRCRLRENTWESKQFIIQKKILPYFKDRKIMDIKSRDIVSWQNEMMQLRDKNGKLYSQTYLKTVHNQLSAIFNHAVKYYGLRTNPARQVGNMGKEESKEMSIWTQEEYKKFSYEMLDKPISFYAFELLYWCGIREGELLALTPGDFDFKNQTMSINKSYQRIKGKDVITEPKTAKGNRVIKLPSFISEEIEEFIHQLYGIKNDERMFKVSKNYLHHEMDRGAKKAGIKRIRIHDLRHSHISLLIEMGYTAVAIADRVGHESIDITFKYAHMFPSTQDDMALKLSDIRNKSEGEI